MARSIVDKPDVVNVTEDADGENVTLTLIVDPDDMGKVIGRHGRIARAIRLVMKAAANTADKKVTVEIAQA
ncbi:MAG: KH domain-containing protein [Eubacteriales bacterium]